MEDEKEKQKTCASCKQDKPLNQYCRYKNTSDGLQSWCKPCMNTYAGRRAKALRGAESFNTPPSKECPRCHQTKASDQYGRNKTRPDGLAVNCKECTRSTCREANYNISQEEFDTFLESQESGCRLCGNSISGKKAVVDHSWSTGEIRGIVCYRCNILLGHMGDNLSDLFTKCLAYLKLTPLKDTGGKIRAKRKDNQ